MRSRMEHRLYLENKVNIWLKPMLVDIVKNKPEKVIDFVIDWCETKGYQYENGQQIVQQQKKTQKIEKENFDYAKEKMELDLLQQKIDQKQIPNQKQQSKSISQYSSQTEESEQENDDEIKEMLQKKQKRPSKKKMGISAEAYGKYNKLGDFVPRVIEKTKEQEQMIKQILSNSFMFNTLDDQNKQIVVKAMEIKNYRENDIVIKQGDDGNELYIVGKGELKCTKTFPGNDKDTFLKTYQKGEIFGELSLLYNTPRAASIISVNDSELFCLDRNTFNNIVKSSAIIMREKYEQFLQKIEIFKGLDPYERSKISDALITKKYKKNEYIIKEGDNGNDFYLIMDGEAVALKTKDGQEQIVFNYRNSDGNDYFGEKALIEKGQRNASIKVVSETMTVASMNGDSFKRMLGPIENILKRNFEKYENFEIKQFNK